MTDLTVATVLWQGDFRGRTYNPDWVRKTAAMCQRLLPPHRFVCLSNVEVPVERIPLESSLEGWWAKLELFRPGNGLKGRVLYLDLDSIIVGKMLELIEHPAPIAFMPPSYTFTGGNPTGGPGIVDQYQASCISFTAGGFDHLFTGLKQEHLKRFRGDQDYLGAVIPKRPTFEPRWFRKLKQCPKGPPAGVKLVLCMPWKNDVAAKKFPWVGEIWKD